MYQGSANKISRSAIFYHIHKKSRKKIYIKMILQFSEERLMQCCWINTEKNHRVHNTKLSHQQKSIVHSHEIQNCNLTEHPLTWKKEEYFQIWIYFLIISTWLIDRFIFFDYCLFSHGKFISREIYKINGILCIAQPWHTGLHRYTYFCLYWNLMKKTHQLTLLLQSI